MTAVTFPKRIVSNPMTISITPSKPAWAPDVGKFNTIFRADQPTVWHNAGLVDPDLYLPSGAPTPSPYPHVFSNPTYNTAFYNQWVQQCGGAFNFELGALGSMLIFGGGHSTWSGCNITRFDLATGKWMIHWQDDVPLYASNERSIVNGTIAAGTGTVSTRASLDITQPDRVVWGNFIKTADDVPIPGAGDINGVGTTVWNPYPIHTNNGICVLPSEAGGGPLGSLLIHGHGQTGITIPTTKWQVFRFDFSTKKWSAWMMGNWMTNQRPEPTLVYDSKRKIVWERGGSGTPVTLDYVTGIGRKCGGPTVNLTGGYIPGFCYMPSRDLMVYMWPSNSGTSTAGVPWAERDGAEWTSNSTGAVVPPHTANSTLQGTGCYIFPRIAAYRLSVTTGANATNTYAHATAASFNPTVFDLTIAPHTSFEARDILDQGLGDTGWPGYRTGSRIATGEQTWHGATDNGCLMQGGCWGWKTHANNGIARGINDGLQYCEDEDCLFIIEKGPDAPSAATILLWKLIPPPIGQEQALPWTWVKETINRQSTSIVSGIGTGNTMGLWSGKIRYHPGLKSIIMTDLPSVPVQAVRSSNWT